VLALGDDLESVWDAPSTTDKDRKQLLRTLLEEVNITVRRDAPDPHAALILRWKGGAITEMTVPLRRPQPKIRTGEDTVALIRRLAVHYPDAVIAGILNRQHRPPVHAAAVAQRRLHRRRAGHPRRPLAHPPHRTAARHARRRRARGLARPSPRQPRARRLPPGRFAEGQARRPQCRPDPHRKKKRPAYRDPGPARRPVLIQTISRGAV